MYNYLKRCIWWKILVGNVGNVNNNGRKYWNKNDLCSKLAVPPWTCNCSEEWGTTVKQAEWKRSHNKTLTSIHHNGMAQKKLLQHATETTTTDSSLYFCFAEGAERTDWVQLTIDRCSLSNKHFSIQQWTLQGFPHPFIEKLIRLQHTQVHECIPFDDDWTLCGWTSYGFIDLYFCFFYKCRASGNPSGF